MKEEILSNHLEVESKNFSDPTTWENLKNILLFHPNAIIRHEACFVIQELQITRFIPDLISAVEHDPSVVVKHEAIEALGKMKDRREQKKIIEFLDGLSLRPTESLWQHPDVVATIEIAKERLKKLP